MESRLLSEIAAHLFTRCAPAADPVDCLEAQIESLRAQNRWTESQLADIEKQTLRLLYEAVTRKQDAKDQ